MSGQIVLGYDGSEGAKAALAEGLALAKALGTSVTLVFGFEAPAFYAGEAGRQRDAIEKIGNTTLEEGLAAAKAIDSSIEVRAEIGRWAPSRVAHRHGRT